MIDIDAQPADSVGLHQHDAEQAYASCCNKFGDTYRTCPRIEELERENQWYRPGVHRLMGSAG